MYVSEFPWVVHSLQTLLWDLDYLATRKLSVGVSCLFVGGSSKMALNMKLARQVLQQCRTFATVQGPSATAGGHGGM